MYKFSQPIDPIQTHSVIPFNPLELSPRQITQCKSFTVTGMGSYHYFPNPSSAPTLSAAQQTPLH